MTQKDFIEILFNDCGFNDASRRSWLVHYFKTADVDSLTVKQRSTMIDMLKEIRSNRKETTNDAERS